MYIDDEFLAEVENSEPVQFKGHVLRIGESTKQFWVGASKLPKPLRGQLFDGQIGNVRFFNYAINESDMTKLINGKKLRKKSVSLDWTPKLTKSSKTVVKGPIRLQSDTSKIRFANIWIESLTRGKK